MLVAGLDMGGTHTDAVLIQDGTVHHHYKTKTDPTDYLGTITRALDQVLAAAGPGAKVRLHLSTTVGTNAIVTGRTSPVGLLLEPGPGLNPQVLTCGQRNFLLSGSIDHRGRPTSPLDKGEIAAVDRKLHAAGIRHLAIVGKFSPRNPAHELTIQEALSPNYDFITLGHRLSGQLNFPRRVFTAYLNSAVAATFADFAQAMITYAKTKQLHDLPQILKADGGTLSLPAAVALPVETILSGPSASIMGALALAPTTEDAIILDIGGTTTDISFLAGGIPLAAPRGINIGSYPTLVRALFSNSLGLGGDSCLRGREGHLRLGPERQGPALALGGPVPTPTDALITLGRLALGDSTAARRGLRALGEELGLDCRKTAIAILQQMAAEIVSRTRTLLAQINSRPVYTVREVLADYKLRPRRVILLGALAPVLAPDLEAAFGLPVVVPPLAEVANAIGAALSLPTAELTLLADTQQQTLTVPEEGIREKISVDYTPAEARGRALDLLARRLAHLTPELQADAAGAPVLEVVEEEVYNMVSGFITTGKNIRVKVQVKPGVAPLSSAPSPSPLAAPSAPLPDPTVPGASAVVSGACLQNSPSSPQCIGNTPSAVPPGKEKTTMLKASHRVGLVFFPAFDWAISPTHPEREERLLYTQDQVWEEGLLDIEGIREYRPCLAPVEAVERVHICVPDVKTRITESHLIAAGGAITAADAVLQGEVDKAFAIIRPPGHHAFRIVHGARGFCTINNEAIMLEHIRRRYGPKRIAIVDTDCHHGDGSQDIYWHDSETLYISLHQDGRTLFPGSGFLTEFGGPNAFGYTLNLPLPPGTGEEGFLYALENFVLPVLEDFQPDLVINSAGQDNHYTDPLTDMRFSARGYARLNELLQPDLTVLEGGYSIEGALPYVNVGIILALAGLDYSCVHEPDYSPASVAQSPAVSEYIARLCAEAYRAWQERDALRIKQFQGQKEIRRQRRIYYDTEELLETQEETTLVCAQCGGLSWIDSHTDRGRRILALFLPRDACPRCQEEGHSLFTRASLREYDAIYLQDRPQDKLLSRVRD